MKTAILLTSFIFTTSLFAQRHDRRQGLESLAKQVSRLTRTELPYLSKSERKDLRRALTKAKNILLDLAPQPAPVPTPAPVQEICSNDQVDLFQQTFKDIKSFAYSSSGLSYNTRSSKEFAIEWTEKYPCQYADKYISKFKKLRTFAYSSNGLRYDTQSAISYAKTNVDSLCSDYNLKEEFSKHYQFAYSPSGLRYSSKSARAYAKAKVEPHAFKCSR